ncbi:MAG: outer membrane protein assembly factor BamB [Gammaproteobacteria bacterium]|nr:outer membrane protein assembly factor BamB [Gammaproteobacteria bacterium]
MSGLWRLVLCVGLMLAFSGCSWFGDDEEEDARDPVPLTAFKAEVQLKKLWSFSVGSGADNNETRLLPVIEGSRIYAAAVDGSIAALDLYSGRKVWKVRLDKQLTKTEVLDEEVQLITGGVAAGRDHLFVTLSTGELVALNKSDGSMSWRSEIGREVLAPAVVSGDLVIVQTIDDKLVAFDGLDGARKWIFSASVPSLTLRGTSTPLIFDRFVIAGFANGRVAVVDMTDGVARFEQRIGVPQGDSDLERLVDIDGAMVMTGAVLYVVSYQGNVVALDLGGGGRPLWGKEASSVAGLAEGFGAIYMAADDGQLEALDTDDGKQVWATEALKYRQLSTPAVIGSYVAVGDLDGYLHLLAQSDGRFVGRKKIDGEPIKSPVIVEGNRLYLMGNSGKLSAFEVR